MLSCISFNFSFVFKNRKTPIHYTMICVAKSIYHIHRIWIRYHLRDNQICKVFLSRHCAESGEKVINYTNDKSYEYERNNHIIHTCICKYVYTHIYTTKSYVTFRKYRHDFYNLKTIVSYSMV